MTTTKRRGSESGNRYSPTGVEELTRSGEMISLLDPRPEKIHMKDIAAHLAAMVRFNGACPLQPTIAQHSLAVEYIASYLVRGGDMTATAPDSLRRAALMHDAAEYLVGDNIGAVKKLMRGTLSWSEFDIIEDRVQEAIVARFDCADTGWEEIIHEADCIACAYEMSRYGWCDAADPPEWAWFSDDLYRCYRHTRDGGESAFIARAAQLGMWWR